MSNKKNVQKKDKMEKADNDTLRYYNSSYINSGTLSTRAKNSETRTTPILENPSEWYGSVIRFDIDARSIPINTPKLVQPIIPLSPDHYVTTSKITLEYLGTFYTQPVIYIEESVDPNQASNNIRDFKLATIYNYQKWLDFVNTAASLAFASTGVVGTPPIFIYNQITGLIDLYVDQNYLSTAVNPINIYVNLDLYSYFLNFNYAFNTQPSATYRFKFIVSNSTTSVMPAVGSRQGLPIAIQTIMTLYRVNQMASSTSSWSSLRSIVLTSNLLPFRTETLPNKATSDQNYSSDNILPIISDYLVPTEAAVTESRVVLEYLPTAQYRYFDLTSNVPLYAVDFVIYWSDFSGNLYPIFLNPGQGMSIKILFQRKRDIDFK